jgi:tetratricopeptide (TPR) repeat protein
VTLATRRLIVGGAAAVLTAAALLLGGVLNSGAPRAARAVPYASPLGGAPDGALVPQLQQQVRANPRDARSLGLLGLAYEQRARETGDAAYYTKADGVLRRALRLVPNDLLATTGLGALALSRHQFRDALALGRRAIAVSPSTARGYGIVGDALVELGRYEEAFETFNKMVTLKPSVSSYARVSYARELLGDVAGAIEAMRLAVDAAAGESESVAWAHTQLGKLLWSHGRPAAAEREYRAALSVRRGYVYALDALALVEAAQGRADRAIQLARRAAEAMPLPQFVGTLGDLLHVSGDEAEAQRQRKLIGAIERLLRANGVRTDLEAALFDIDHGTRLSVSLALARSSHAARPSIDGDDVLSWALVRNGHCGEALRYSKRALRLGTLDAPKFFHRGMIERCLGHDAVAKRWFRRALATNPHFSLLWSPVAERYAS